MDRASLMLLLFSAIASAQFDQGQIAGTVKDSSDAVVSGAEIVALNKQSQLRTTAATGQNGSYILTNLPVGYYDVSVQAAGFKKYVQSNVKVDAATRSTLDATLEVGQVSETVNVEGTFTLIQRETAQIGRIVESRQITDLALNGRNPIKLTLLKAGVVGGSNFNAFSPTGLHEQFSINGGRRAGNNVTIDGVNAMRTRGDWNGSAQLGLLNVDTIQEVQILTSTYPAEYGHAMDGQIRFVSKSGTRDFHGSAFFFHRNSALDANSWTRNNSPNRDESRRPAPFRFNQPGYAIGGPIFVPGKFNTGRDRLFFFGSQEWLIFRQEKTSTATVPSEAMRRGDFSELLSASNPFFRRTRLINDPLAGAPFAGNIIPAARLSPNGVGILNSYPLPTPGYLAGTDNWIKTRPNPRDSRKDSIRVDYYQGKHRMSFSGTHFTYHEDDPFLTNLDRSNSRWDRPNMTGAVSVTSTLSPTLINDLTVTAANDVVRIGIFDNDGQPLYLRTRYGMNFPYIVPGAKRIPERIPTAAITGFTTVDGSSRPVSSSGPMYTLAENFTWIKGSAHTLKFGAAIEHAEQNNNDQIGQQNGQITFNDAGHPLSTGVAAANVATGAFDNYIERGPAAYTLLRSKAFEAYAQDTWKATPTLTLELGVRYSYFQPWYAKWNDIANFNLGYYDPARRAVVDPVGGYIVSGDQYNGIVLPGSGYPESARGRAYGASLPNVDRLFHNLPRGFVNSYRNAFAPRFGVAYRAIDKTVIRAGAGIFHHRQMHNQGSLFRNPPNQVEISVQNGIIDRPGGSTQRDFPLSVKAIDLNAKIPTALSYSLSIQRELPGSMVLELAYVGKTAINQERIRAINNMRAGTIQRNPGVNQAALRPYHGLGPVDWTTRDGRVNYNSLQISMDRRFNSGLGFGVSYTFSRSIGNLMNLLAPALPYDPYNFVKALDELDRPHLLNLNFVYQLPFYKQAKGLAGGVLGGWQLSGVIFLRSGQPLASSDATDFAGVGVGSGPSPWNLVGSLDVQGERGIGRQWFNPAAFALPAAGTFGNAGLSIIRGPASQDFDLAIFKDFRIVERLSSQFRVEVFNFPNHPVLNNPGTNPRAGNFGLITAKSNQRSLQLGLKFLF